MTLGTSFQLLEPTPFETGQSLPSAQLYFYQTGTTTDQAVYTSADLSTAHAQPVVADSDGLFPAIYLNPDATADYRVRLLDSDSNQVWQYDSVQRYSENFDTDTFEVTYGGFSADPSATTATYYRFGRLVLIELPVGTGTSNSTSFSISGLPAAIRPASTQYAHVPFAEDNGSANSGGAVVQVQNASQMNVALNDGSYAAASWTNSSTKGLTTYAPVWYRLVNT